MPQHPRVIFQQDADEVARSNLALAQDVAEYEQMVRASVSGGQLLTAIEVARDGLARFGPSRGLQQQLALALAQTGALDAAQDLLRESMRESASDEETLCLLGRVHKELWRRARQPAEAAEALRQSCKFYGDAFAQHETYYPGINLAFTLAAAGEGEQARECARKVEKICERELGRGRPADGWLLATLGEALTHQGATAEAGEYYRKAAEIFRGRWRDLASMRRQAREVWRFTQARENGAEAQGGLAAWRRRAREFFGRAEPGEEWLERCFDFPSVAVFSGHMIDSPGRAAPRFTPAMEATVREEIRLHLLRIKAGFGYSSAASGGDLLFCECLLEMEAKVHLVLSCPVEAFKRQSVSAAGPEWERRFHHVLAHASTCVVANPAGYTAPGAPSHPASPMGLVYTNRIATGLAVLQAQALDLELHAIALWDGRPPELPGGTASVVEAWRRRNIEPHIVSLPATATTVVTGARSDAAPGGAADVSAATSPAAVTQTIKALLFAEVANFHKVGEEQMPAFVTVFKGAMAKLMAETAGAPAIAESWSAAHYFAYDDLGAAARFALALRDLVVETPWAQHGLPADIGLRIVLHAGPVFVYEDPTLGRLTCGGAHVNRAGRIWPIMPVGQVYATQGFAALCGAEAVASATFEYLGYLRTTTMFEDAALYRVDRRE